MWQYLIVRRKKYQHNSKWLCVGKNGRPKWIDWQSDKLSNIVWLSEEEMKSKMTNLKRHGSKKYIYSYKRGRYLINGKYPYADISQLY